jgi:hypothetical protein
MIMRGQAVGNGELRVDTGALQRAVKGLDQAIDQLDGHLAELESDLAGFGAPWGGDDIGFLIQAAYEGIAGIAMDCFTTNMEELESALTGLESMSGTYERSEQDSVVEVNRVREFL